MVEDYLQVFGFILLLWVQSIPLELGVSQYLSTEDGLSNNIIYDIYQDHQGFIWIATENGLNRFDGYEFKKFYHSDKDSTTLSSNIVRSITEDQKGNLWIGTFNGLNLFDRKTETFTRFIDLSEISTNRLDLKQLKLTTDGRLWFNTLDVVGWFDINQREFQFIDFQLDPFSITTSGKEKVFIQSKNGDLFEYDGGTNSLTTILSRNKVKEYPIHWGAYTDQLWLYSNSSFNQNDIRIKRIPKLPQDIKPSILLEVNEENLIIASDNGLFIYSLSKSNLKPIDFGERNSSLTNSIRSVYQDKNGGRWVGTLNGIFYFDPYQKPFEHIDITEGSDIVMGMEAFSNSILINSFSQKMISYDVESKELSEFLLPTETPEGFFQIWDIEYVPDSDYPLWLATNAGLFLFNPSSKKHKYIKLDKADETFQSSFAIAQDQAAVWVSSVFGLYKLDKATGRIIKTVTSIKHPLGSIIQDIQKTEDGFLVATEGDGILFHELGAEKMEPLESKIEGADQLQTIPVWDIFKSEDETIWIGTNRGLFKLDWQKSDFRFISEGTSLENTVVFSIQEDDKENLWLGTEKGIMRFEIPSGKVTTYSKSDGVQNVEFNRKSSLKTEDGRLWFGGIEGVTVFDPDQIRPNEIIPPVYITNATVITSDSVFTPQGVFEKEIHLPWNQNTLEFQFTALNFTNPSQNKYRYKLEGYDPAWVEGGANRIARYVQLPHGEYTFRVQGSNNDGLWNTEGAYMQITISPPYWKTWWFRFLVVALVVLLLWLVYRYRVKQLLEIERVKLRIAGDLHDEIGSGLSGIALTGDILSKQLNNGGAKPELVERITKSSRSLASSLDTIVWLIDPKKETLGDLISKCQITAQELLSDKKVKVETNIKEKEEGEVLDSSDRRNLFLFFKEAIHNVAKHSNAEEVKIHFLKTSGGLIIEIQDDGVGFDVKHTTEGRGIGTMSQRASELQSELILKSDMGKGTLIRLSAKIP